MDGRLYGGHPSSVEYMAVTMIKILVMKVN